ncbi:MAG: ATP phosphoribosyltransferase [Gammaproteobacteria bacterium]|jgi:ATP phosphoribosyltransferase
MLTLALSKGRILEQTLPLLASAGIELLEDPNRSRKLILPTNHANLRVVVIRAQDVPTFVEHGGADLGVTGKDVLMEHNGSGLYEPLDLGIARCRLMVAAPVGALEGEGVADGDGNGGDSTRGVQVERARLRVATKYERITRRYYAARGMQVEIIKLYGSMELAPLVGLADRIVDLVETGRTLEANGLVAVDHVIDISSWLVVNKASMKIQPDAVKALIADLGEAVAAASEASPNSDSASVPPVPVRGSAR